MGFKIVSLQIKIGDYEQPFFMGPKITIMSFIFRPVFAQNQDCNECSGLLMSEYMKDKRDGSLKLYRLIETRA